MPSIVLYFCGSSLPVFTSEAKCKVIFNYRQLLLNEAFLMQTCVSKIKDKESAPVAKHKRVVHYLFHDTMLTKHLFYDCILEICAIYNSKLYINFMKSRAKYCWFLK